MNPKSKHSRHHRSKKKGLKGIFYKIKKFFVGSSVTSNGPENSKPYLGSESRRSSSGRRKSSWIRRIKRKWKDVQRERKKRRYLKRRKSQAKKFQKVKSRKSLMRKYFPFLMRFGLVEDRGEVDSEQKMKIKRAFVFYFLNSTVLYIIAYLLIYFTYQITVLVAASLWKIDAVLFYFDLVFNDLSPLWSRPNIIFVTFSGPFISLIIGLIFYQIFSRRPNFKVHTRLFMLWIGLHGLNLFFGAFASGVSFNEGFGYVPLWLFLNVFWRIFISILFLFILIVFGYFTTAKFLSTTNSPYRIRKENRQSFIFSQAILPWFFGGLILYLIKIPNNMPYDTGNLVTMLFLVVPTLFNTRARPYIKIKKDPTKQTVISWIPLLIVIIMLIGFRVGLKDGYQIKLILDIALNISPL